MISGRGWPITLSVVLLSLTCASRAIADPIEPPNAVLAITSGQLGFDHDSDDPFAQGQLFGPDFSLFLHVEGTQRFGGPELSLQSPFAFASLRIAGADLDLGGGPFQMTGHVSPTGPLRLVVTPPGPDDTQFVGVLSYPFRLSAALSGFAADGTAFHFDLRGQGSGSTRWIGFGSPDPGRDVDTTLTFSPAAPTPEPGTLVLMGIGAAFARFGFTRRHKAALIRNRIRGGALSID